MTATAKLYRDRSPEACALGGWYVILNASGELVTTDFYRSARSAMAAALALAGILGLQLVPR